MVFRERGFLGLSGADYRLKYTWTTTRCSDTTLSQGGLPTREVTLNPDETAFFFPNRSGSDHDKLEAHLFEPLYAIQGTRDWQGTVNPVRAVILQYFTLGRKSSQHRVGEASVKIVLKSPWETPSQGSVNSSALAV